MNPELLYQIGLTLIPGIGVINAKNLIAHCGGAEAVFKEKRSLLKRIYGIGDKAVANISGQEVLKRAEEEIAFIEKEHIKPVYFLDPDYPERLRSCEDGPLIFYQKGDIDLNRHHIVAIVGSRNATDYGREFCEKFIADLKPFHPLVVSGLAYGIDIASHKAALENNIPTVGVLGHGLDHIYPSLHRNIARKMIEQEGGLITEFLSGSRPDRENFPKRNRIVAGMSDAIVVVEAARKGGALITAEIGNSYNRDVFTVPGRLNDPYSEGCNHLIKANKAALITGVEDLQYILGWEKKAEKRSVQRKLFVDLDDEESHIQNILTEAEGKAGFDTICARAQLPVSKILTILMTLELKGVVRSLPGRQYALI